MPGLSQLVLATPLPKIDAETSVIVNKRDRLGSLKHLPPPVEGYILVNRGTSSGTVDEQSSQTRSSIDNVADKGFKPMLVSDAQLRTGQPQNYALCSLETKKLDYRGSV